MQSSLPRYLLVQLMSGATPLVGITHLLLCQHNHHSYQQQQQQQQHGGGRTDGPPPEATRSLWQQSLFPNRVVSSTCSTAPSPTQVSTLSFSCLLI
jgi:hypothetical protein